jgi:DNA-directed RNA polymerase sigma subunit (sigma70/sigma32)
MPVNVKRMRCLLYVQQADGATLDEIAASEGVSRERARQLINQAMIKFEAELERRGIGREVLALMEPCGDKWLPQG